MTPSKIIADSCSFFYSQMTPSISQHLRLSTALHVIRCTTFTSIITMGSLQQPGIVLEELIGSPKAILSWRTSKAQRSSLINVIRGIRDGFICTLKFK
jgi:hypothetical protein